MKAIIATTAPAIIKINGAPQPQRDPSIAAKANPPSPMTARTWPGNRVCGRRVPCFIDSLHRQQQRGCTEGLARDAAPKRRADAANDKSSDHGYGIGRKR